MLAYSSIAHTGYLLIGILAAPQSELGLMPTVVYLVAYAIMNLGAFVVLGLISGRGDMGLEITRCFRAFSTASVTGIEFVGLFVVYGRYTSNGRICC